MHIFSFDGGTRSSGEFVTAAQWWGFGRVVRVAEFCPQCFINEDVVGSVVVVFLGTKREDLVGAGLCVGVEAREQDREWHEGVSQRIESKRSGS